MLRGHLEGVLRFVITARSMDFELLTGERLPKNVQPIFLAIHNQDARLMIHVCYSALYGVATWNRGRSLSSISRFAEIHDQTFAGEQYLAEMPCGLIGDPAAEDEMVVRLI